MATKENEIMNVRIQKHTKKSCFADDNVPKINIDLLKYNEDTTVFEANENKYILSFYQNGNKTFVSLKQGNNGDNVIVEDIPIDKLVEAIKSIQGK